MEQALQAVVLAVLDRIDAEVNFSQQLNIFNKSQLVDFSNVIQTQIQKFEAIDALKSTKALYLIFGQIKCSQNWKSFKTFDLSQVVCTYEQLFDPEAFQVFDSFDAVAVERENSELLVVVETINIGDLIVVQIQVFQVEVTLSARDSADLVARVINPL